jgi:hypothetical protein
MDHTEATAEQLVERYVLDELDDEKAERFEEHYFECADCANDLRAAVTLMRYGAELPKEEVATNVVPISRDSGFRTWLATAAAAVIGFVVAVPVLRTPAPVPMLADAHELGIDASQYRASEADAIETLTVGKNDPVVFVIDVVPGQREYTVSVRSTDGRITLPPWRVTAAPGAITVSVVALHLPAGTYEVTAPPAATKKFRVIHKEGES